MESFLPYFVEFQDDSIISYKEYPKKYMVDGLDWRPIIITKYDENIFSTNNNQ